MNVIQEGQVSIVTGGASGIGRAVARGLAERGVYPVIFDIDIEGANAVVAELAQQGKAARTMPIDVRDRAAVTDAVNEVFGLKKRLDSIFNIAGVSVHERNGMLSFTQVPLGGLAKFARALLSARSGDEETVSAPKKGPKPRRAQGR